MAESYATQYPELCLVLEVPYDAEGSVVGVTKGNAALLEGVNRAIAAAKEDGSFDQYRGLRPTSWLPATSSRAWWTKTAMAVQ